MLLYNYQTDNKYLKMDKNYIVGDLIYDAAIYDGLNTFLETLLWYRTFDNTYCKRRIQYNWC